MLVEFRSAVDHGAVSHQGLIDRPGNRAVPKCDGQAGRRQQDVEGLPFKQGLSDWII